MNKSKTCEAVRAGRKNNYYEKVFKKNQTERRLQRNGVRRPFNKRGESEKPDE
jgi:hypothetical protein